jgi:hypothetical protein
MTLPVKFFPAAHAEDGFTASQHLAEILLTHGFRSSELENGRFIKGRIHYFRNGSDCTVCFLKDGRVHVLAGPTGMWQLHDQLTDEDLSVLLAFASMSEECQTIFRNYMAPKCTNYGDVLNLLPKSQLKWSAEFRQRYSVLLMQTLYLRAAI